MEKGKTALLALSALLLGAYVFAALSPLETAADYTFTKPNLPSNIVGRIMGLPPDYYVPRSEDVAFLREAYAELDALRKGAIPSPRLAAADFPQMSADVGAINLTNPGGDESGYLSTNDTDWISTYTRAEDFGSVTNVSTVGWEMITNYVFIVTNEYIRIDNPASVHTNTWYLPVYQTTTNFTTNVVNKSIFGMFFDAGIPAGQTNALPSNRDRWVPARIVAANITNHYAYLRAFRRLADSTDPTNALPCPVRYRTVDDGTVDEGTNTAGLATLLTRHVDATRATWKWYSGDEPRSYETSGSTWSAPDGWNAEMDFPSRFTFDVLHTRGAETNGESRVSRAALWAVVRADWDKRASHTAPGGATQSYATNRTTYVAMPLGKDAEERGTTGTNSTGRVIFRAAQDLNQLHLAGMVLGMGSAFPSAPWTIDHHFPVGEASKSGGATSEDSESYRTSISFWLVYDLAPAAVPPAPPPDEETQEGGAN